MGGGAYVVSEHMPWVKEELVWSVLARWTAVGFSLSLFFELKRVQRTRQTVFINIAETLHGGPNK
jgi:hypothetical protein